MYWIAINQEAATPAKLKAEILPKVSGRQLMEALEALAERSLIEDRRSLNETGSTSLMLQPAIVEYVRERYLSSHLKTNIKRSIGRDSSLLSE
jgi:hypothetical protein